MYLIKRLTLIFCFPFVISNCAEQTSYDEDNFTPYLEPSENGTLNIDEMMSDDPVIKRISELIINHPSCGDSKSSNNVTLKKLRGYYLGTLYSFAKNICRGNGAIKASMLTGSTDHTRDSLYNIKNIKIYANLESVNEEHLKSIYSILLHHGLNESGGDFRTGYDKSNLSSLDPQNAEAGLYQTSFSVRFAINTSSKEALMELESEYLKNPQKCKVNLFKIDLNSKIQSPYVGKEGEGFIFQKLLRTCPSLAADHGAITIRHNMKHYGPLINGTSTPFNTCSTLLEELYTYINTNRISVCPELVK